MGDFSPFTDHDPTTHHPESIDPATEEQPPPPKKACTRIKGNVYRYPILEVHTLSLSMVSVKKKSKLIVAENENHSRRKKKSTVYYVYTHYSQ